jgi:hypothetical protein
MASDVQSSGHPNITVVGKFCVRGSSGVIGVYLCTLCCAVDARTREECTARTIITRQDRRGCGPIHARWRLIRSSGRQSGHSRPSSAHLADVKTLCFSANTAAPQDGGVAQAHQLHVPLPALGTAFRMYSQSMSVTINRCGPGGGSVLSALLDPSLAVMIRA